MIFRPRCSTAMICDVGDSRIKKPTRRRVDAGTVASVHRVASAFVEVSRRTEGKDEGKHRGCFGCKESPPNHLLNSMISGTIIRQRLQGLQMPRVKPSVTRHAVDLGKASGMSAGRHAPGRSEIDKNALRDKRSVEQLQGMNHALARHSSKRPGKDRDLKALIRKP